MVSGSIQALIAAVPFPDAEVARRARARQRHLTKPPGSLGRLEPLSVQVAAILRSERPAVRGSALILAAADHGVVAQGVTAYPQAVTAQMVANFVAGGAAVSALSRRAGVRLMVVDAGIADRGAVPASVARLAAARVAADISAGPAMSRTAAEALILGGAALAREAADAGADLIGLGEMGIGNTTPSSAIVAAMTGLGPDRTTGRGTGRDDLQLQRKIGVVERALAVNRPDRTDPLGVLARVGGSEIAVLVGVILGAAAERRVVVLDGFITAAAALVAVGLSPVVRGFLVASHRSAEQGHRVALRQLRLRPLLDLRMRLGEGTGALLAMDLVDAAAACLREMATFEQAAVSGRSGA